MQIPASELFTPISLADRFNRDRAALDELLRVQLDDGFGRQTCRGIPFEFGAADQANVILLDDRAVCVSTGDLQATYLVFAHTVEDRPLELTPDLADFEGAQHFPGDLPGNDLGDLVAEYQLEYVDGSRETVPIRRRFAIQQARIGWGASAFAAVEHQQHTIESSVSEQLQLGQMPEADYGRGETRHQSGRDANAEYIWLYALPNPHPDKTISAIHCIPKSERALIFGISATQVVEHPLRSQVRRKLELTLPAGVEFNGIGELDDVDIDLGYVISARAKLEYDHGAWFSDATNVQPARSKRAAITRVRRAS